MLSIVERQLDLITSQISSVAELSSALDDFNLFDLLGSAHLELAHTRILEFLFDPKGAHGFRDGFARAFLTDVSLRYRDRFVGFDFNALGPGDLNGIEIDREWQRIDLLVVDETQRIAILIENKIHSSEHSAQLERYLDIVTERFPKSEWRIVPIYLTLAGDPPSHATYVAMTYRSVANIISELLDQSELLVASPIRVTLVQYVELLRRSFVGDDELARRAKELYDSAPHGFDFIVKNKTYPQSELKTTLESLIHRTPGFIFDSSGPHLDGRLMVRFSHHRLEAWQQPSATFGSEPWTKSRRTIMFQFDIWPKSVVFRLEVGPGPASLRRQLIDMAASIGKPFDTTFQQTNVGRQLWRAIYKRTLLAESDFFDFDLKRLEALLLERWELLIEEDIDAILDPFASFDAPGDLD